MRKTFLSILGAALMTTSVIQMAAATERHQVPKMDRASVSRQFRNANAFVAPDQYSEFEYWRGRGFSAPAGH